MGVKKATILFLVMFVSSWTPSAFAYTQDTGTILELYTADNGAIAIKLSGGFPSAAVNNPCPGNNGYAGSSTANNALKAALLTAKLLASNVRVTLTGCDGIWYKITDVYILN